MWFNLNSLSLCAFLFRILANNSSTSLYLTFHILDFLNNNIPLTSTQALDSGSKMPRDSDPGLLICLLSHSMRASFLVASFLVASISLNIVGFLLLVLGSTIPTTTLLNVRN